MTKRGESTTYNGDGVTSKDLVGANLLGVFGTILSFRDPKEYCETHIGPLGPFGEWTLGSQFDAEVSLCRLEDAPSMWGELRQCGAARSTPLQRGSRRASLS